jgi:hypothetical protein
VKRRIIASIALAPLFSMACSKSPAGTARDGATDSSMQDATGTGGIAGTGDALGTGGASGSQCFGYGPPVTSTVHGIGFDAWNGSLVSGCFYASQPVAAPACGEANVMGGAFTLTQSECTGIRWTVSVYSAVEGNLTCSFPIFDNVTITPDDCNCPDANHAVGTPCPGRPINDAGRDANDGGAAEVADAQGRS